MNLERQLGPMGLRAWGLVLNLLFNIVALYGLSRYLAQQDGATTIAALTFGSIGTLVCLLVLAQPAEDDDPSHHQRKTQR